MQNYYETSIFLIKVKYFLEIVKFKNERHFYKHLQAIVNRAPSSPANNEFRKKAVIYMYTSRMRGHRRYDSQALVRHLTV